MVRFAGGASAQPPASLLFWCQLAFGTGISRIRVQISTPTSRREGKRREENACCQGIIAREFYALAAGHSVAGDAVRFQVPLDNLGVRSEPGSGHATVVLAEGRGEVNVEGLRLVPHNDPLGTGRVVGYAAWLVNSEDALGKLNLGFLFPIPTERRSSNLTFLVLHEQIWPCRDSTWW
jgi:hypothetical protein